MVNGWPKCVPKPLRDNVRCGEGTTCKMVDGWPKYVPKPSCKNFHCGQGTQCKMAAGGPSCVGQQLLCRTVFPPHLFGCPPSCPLPCPQGTTCHLVSGWPHCVPTVTPLTGAPCGAIRCPQGTMCRVIDSWLWCLQVNTPPTQQCRDGQCPRTTMCKMMDEWPKCVPKPLCDNICCEQGTQCKMAVGGPTHVGPVLSCGDRTPVVPTALSAE